MYINTILFLGLFLLDSFIVYCLCSLALPSLRLIYFLKVCLSPNPHVSLLSHHLAFRHFPKLAICAPLSPGSMSEGFFLFSQLEKRNPTRGWMCTSILFFLSLSQALNIVNHVYLKSHNFLIYLLTFFVSHESCPSFGQ